METKKAMPALVNHMQQKDGYSEYNMIMMANILVLHPIVVMDHLLSIQIIAGVISGLLELAG